MSLIYFLSIIYFVLECDDSQTVFGKCCVFPFTYDSVEYTECTNVDNLGVFWCATEVSESGGVNKYESCDMSEGSNDLLIKHED